MLSLQSSAISRLGDLDSDALASMWTVFTKCKENLENGRRLENLSWRLWFSKSDLFATRSALLDGNINANDTTAEWSDPEGFETMSEDESDQEQLSEFLAPRATRPPLFTHPTGSSMERRALTAKTISGTSLERMISGLNELVTPLHRSSSKDAATRPVHSPLRDQIETRSSPKCVNADSPLPVSPPLQSTPTVASAISPPCATLRSGLSLRPFSAPRSASSRSLSAQVNAHASSSRLVALSRPAPSTDRLASQVTADIPRNFSTSSFEPKSFTRGFEPAHRPQQPSVGSIAPPPTPALVRAHLASPPPSAMKSTHKSNTNKKIFFISSPNSDSEDESRSRSRERGGLPCSSRSTGVNPPSNSLTSIPATPPSQRRRRPPPPAVPTPVPTSATEDDWDDAEEEDDDASSGWGSEYSTESDAPTRRTSKPERPTPLFAKRPSTVNVLEAALKPRPAGLLSQLFHPPFGQDEPSSSRSYDDVSRVGGMQRGQLHGSKSTGMLTEQRRTKSFLRGAPVGTEMDLDSEGEEVVAVDEKGFEDVESSVSSPRPEVGSRDRFGGLKERAHQSMLDLAGAYPQTPRTTRRAMLATELSESLRRNLLWERQTRNKVIIRPAGAAQTVVAPFSAEPVRQGSKSGSTRASTSGGKELSVPHPSPATSSPFQPIVRRHTTGTGLYLAAQTGKFGDSSSSLSISEDDEGDGEGRDAFGFTDGVHTRGW